MSTEQPVSVFDVRPRLEECFTRINKLLAILESSGEAKHIIAATAELRRILQFSARTLDLALRAESRAAFEAEVIETLRKLSAADRRRAISQLQTQSHRKPKTPLTKSLPSLPNESSAPPERAAKSCPSVNPINPSSDK